MLPWIRLVAIAFCSGVVLIFKAAQGEFATASSLVQHYGVGPRQTSHSSSDVLFLADESDSGGLEELLVVRGQRLFLECFSKEEKDAIIPKLRAASEHIRWFQDGKQAAADARVTWSPTGRLVVSHAISRDSGVWHCTGGAFKGRRVRIVVTIPPERPFLVYGGAQLAYGARLTTRAGNPLSLRCVVEGGNPAPTISWTLKGEDVTHLSQVHSRWKSEEGVFSTISNVTVREIEKDDHNATVTCVVRHTSLPRHVVVSLHLNIEYPPDFRLRRWPAWGSPVRDGANVSLFCLVDANPPSDPLWVRTTDGGSLDVASSGPWLNLTQVTFHDRGWYKCKTAHAFGHFSSHSVFINVIRVRELASIPGSYEKSNSKGSLTQQKVVYNDAASRCHDSEFYKLEKSDSPRVQLNASKVVAQYGDSLSISGQICGRQLVDDVTWLPPQRQNPIFPGGRRSNITATALNITRSNCYVSTLTIGRVSNAHAGRWVLLAVAEEGAAATAVAWVNVTIPSHSVAAATAGTRRTDGCHALTEALLLLAVLSQLPLRG